MSRLVFDEKEETKSRIEFPFIRERDTRTVMKEYIYIERERMVKVCIDLSWRKNDRYIYTMCVCIFPGNIPRKKEGIIQE